MIGSKIKNAVVNLLFPPRCIICGERISVISAITVTHCVCKRCRASYEVVFCEVCSICNRSVSDCVCGARMGRAEASPLAKCFFYKPQKENHVGNRIVYALKRRDDKRISELLSTELSGGLLKMMKNEGINPEECVYTFVPRRRAAIYKYGFDQGKRLAHYTAIACGGKARTLILRSGGKEQKKLDLPQREKNLKDAFTLKLGAKRRISGKTVCVVDDVVTTGATMRAAENILISAGAKRVIFACIARTKNGN